MMSGAQIWYAHFLCLYVYRQSNKQHASLSQGLVHNACLHGVKGSTAVEMQSMLCYGVVAWSV